MTVKKVLVPVDGSQSSLRALKFAARRYARAADTRLLVLNVQERLPPSPRVPRTLIAEHQSRLAETALEPARALIRKLRIEADFHVRTGDVAATIVSFARRMRCREIVMGTRGLGRVRGLLLGSVAIKVVHLSPLPVTLIK